MAGTVILLATGSLREILVVTTAQKGWSSPRAERHRTVVARALRIETRPRISNLETARRACESESGLRGEHDGAYAVRCARCAVRVGCAKLEPRG